MQVIIKSVNGRFLETRFHLPKEFNAFESDLKKLLEQKVARGTVDVYVTRRGQMARRPIEVRIREDILGQWLQRHADLKKVQKKAAFQISPLTTTEILGLPHVVETFEAASVPSAEAQLLKTSFKKALDTLDRSRKREGQHLKKELTNFFKQLAQLVEKMRNKREKANALLQEKLALKFKALGFHHESVEQRLSQEILFHIDKSDITEELSRLSEHIRACLVLLRASQPEGKRLEFYNQELLREVNTIGSKSQLSELTALVVESKTIIEKIREQVQNIE